MKLSASVIFSAFFLSGLAAAAAAFASGSGPLTFEDRVAAQAAIERVYYEHRIWPKENPGPKPTFEEMVPSSQIEAKVLDYLKKSAALEKYWQRPITAMQLQAEMDRMARGTRDPAVLKELFASLHDNPRLIAECLARPILANRLIHNWCGFDTRCHAEAREKAERALKEADSENLASWLEGGYHKATFNLQAGQKIREDERTGREDIALEKEEFEKLRAEAPKAGRLAFRETDEAFMVERTLEASNERVTVESLVFAKQSFGSWWEKTSPLVSPAQPAIAFSAFTVPGLPPGPPASPAADWWAATPIFPGFKGHIGHTAVWTGTEMIIWGGGYATSYLNTGGRYNPSTDTWEATSTGADCPTPRCQHTAVWTGTEMLIWGGYGTDWTNNSGGRYNPVSDTWTTTSTGANCPSIRGYHTAVWTGSEMIVWGGNDVQAVLNTGGRYNPSTDAWAATSTGTNCPSGRMDNTAVWTGAEMIVWGGGNDVSTTNTINTGGRYNPSTDTWAATSTGVNCPSVRRYHSAVWTGKEMIVWGGYDGIWLVNTGGRYNPAIDRWTATSMGTNCPDERGYHTAVWTGTEMIVWGGHCRSFLNTGGRYNPSTNSWTATSTGSNCPAARVYHRAVWTGTVMIVWGGYTYTNFFDTGGVYFPSIIAKTNW